MFIVSLLKMTLIKRLRCPACDYNIESTVKLKKMEIVLLIGVFMINNMVSNLTKALANF